jgi:hypothetical protein
MEMVSPTWFWLMTVLVAQTVQMAASEFCLEMAMELFKLQFPTARAGTTRQQ